MRYLLDTNLLCKETQPRARNWIVQHQLQIAIASMTVAEIAQGIEVSSRGRRRMRLEGFLREILEDYQVLPFDTAAALAWGNYVAKAGRPLPVRDSIIAATALANNLEVVTENEDDFVGVDTVNPLRD
ncbi:MAG TPA: PIN domain-containing protein [Verrucomicrobiae bacterium]|nr:PIN domain-containing protein [Verrucomicrobiae bacterium]